MTQREAKILALKALWGWASYLHEGHPDKLSDHFSGDEWMGRVTEEEAFKIQAEAAKESEKIMKRLRKLKAN
jgi:hypothetical protein